MDSQSIHPLRRFSPAEPDLVSATEAFKKLNHFMSVLPASLKKKIDEEIHWHVGAQLPFDSWFFGPNCIAIDADRFDGAVDDITLLLMERTPVASVIRSHTGTPVNSK